MIIKFDNFLEFILKKPDQKFFLFHGPNFGKANEGLEKIIQHQRNIKKIDVINVHSQELKKGDLAKLFSVHNTPNIFGNFSLLSIYLNEEKLSKEIINCLSNMDTTELIVVIRSEQLSKRSPLRSHFEKSKSFTIIPCYEETPREKNFLISNLFKTEKIDIDHQTLSLLSEKLPNDRLEIKNEIEKIIVLTKILPNKFSTKYLQELISDSLEIDSSKFINALIEGESNSFFREYNKFTDFGNDNLRLMSYLIEHLFKLIIVKNKIREGKGIKQSMDDLKPPIFFKYQDSFIRQIQCFKENDLKKIIKKLFECKRCFFENAQSSNFAFLFVLLEFFQSKDSPKTF